MNIPIRLVFWSRDPSGVFTYSQVYISERRYFGEVFGWLYRVTYSNDTAQYMSAEDIEKFSGYFIQPHEVPIRSR